MLTDICLALIKLTNPIQRKKNPRDNTGDEMIS